MSGEVGDGDVWFEMDTQHLSNHMYKNCEKWRKQQKSSHTKTYTSEIYCR